VSAPAGAGRGSAAASGASSPTLAPGSPTGSGSLGSLTGSSGKGGGSLDPAFGQPLLPIGAPTYPWWDRGGQQAPAEQQLGPSLPLEPPGSCGSSAGSAPAAGASSSSGSSSGQRTFSFQLAGAGGRGMGLAAAHGSPPSVTRATPQRIGAGAMPQATAGPSSDSHGLVAAQQVHKNGRNAASEEVAGLSWPRNQGPVHALQLGTLQQSSPAVHSTFALGGCSSMPMRQGPGDEGAPGAAPKPGSGTQTLIGGTGHHRKGGSEGQLASPMLAQPSPRPAGEEEPARAGSGALGRSATLWSQPDVRLSPGSGTQTAPSLTFTSRPGEGGLPLPQPPTRAPAPPDEAVQRRVLEDTIASLRQALADKDEVVKVRRTYVAA
jgi:hypothetical protein